MRRAAHEHTRSRSSRRPHRRVVLRLVAALSTAALCSCSPAASQSVDPGGATAVPRSSGGSDEDLTFPSPQPFPTWDRRSRIAAVRAAHAALSAYVRHDAPARWFSRLSPRLSPSAAVAYQGTDPANIPAGAVRGPGRIVRTPSTYLALVQIATDVGPYRVLVSREGPASPWLVERITPPVWAGS